MSLETRCAWVPACLFSFSFSLFGGFEPDLDVSFPFTLKNLGVKSHDNSKLIQLVDAVDKSPGDSLNWKLTLGVPLQSLREE